MGPRAVWLAAGLLCGAPTASRAQDATALSGNPPAAWRALAVLRARADLSSDLSGVRRDLDNLVASELTSTDPALGAALLALGELRWLAGDVDGARDALDACVRQAAQRVTCAMLRGTIDLEVEAVRAIPVRWTFDDADHGLFHPRAFWDRGSIRLDSRDGDGVLAWSSRVDALGEDQLVAGLDRPSPAPTRLRLRATSREVEARLEVRLIDDLGHAYLARAMPFRLPRRQTVDLDIALRDAIPVDPTSPPLDPARLYRLVLRDATGTTGFVGRNEIALHELALTATR